MAAPRTPPLPLPHPIEYSDEHDRDFKNMPKQILVGGYCREARFALCNRGTRFGGGDTRFNY